MNPFWFSSKNYLLYCLQCYFISCQNSTGCWKYNTFRNGSNLVKN